MGADDLPSPWGVAWHVTRVRSGRDGVRVHVISRHTEGVGGDDRCGCSLVPSPYFSRVGGRTCFARGGTFFKNFFHPAQSAQKIGTGDEASVGVGVVTCYAE